MGFDIDEDGEMIPESKEDKSVWNDIKKKSKAIESKLGDNGTLAHPDFGLCSGCDYFYYQATRYEKENVVCTEYDVKMALRFRPSRIDPIKECSGYYPKGGMSLSDMASIAVLINPDNATRIQVGFHVKDEKKK